MKKTKIFQIIYTVLWSCVIYLTSILLANEFDKLHLWKWLTILVWFVVYFGMLFYLAPIISKSLDDFKD